MKYAIISDIHANVDALRRILADAAHAGAEKVICLGDVVGYGPLPKEALSIVRKSSEIVLAGNHDDAVSGRIGTKAFIPVAGDAARRHHDELTKGDLAWLRELPYTVDIEGATCVHANLVAPADFAYVDSPEAAQASFEAMRGNLLFVGHTHIPGIHLADGEDIYWLDAQDFLVEDGKRYIVNVGSVGYPRERNGRCLSTYVLYDSTRRTVRFHALPFAVSSMLQRGDGRRQRRRTVLLATLLALAGGALALFSIRPRETQSAAETVQTKAVVNAAIAERKIPLSSAHKWVQANIRLESGSPEAHLTIDFVNAGGEHLPPQSFTVRQSSQLGFAVPEGATCAIFTVREAVDGEPPRIKTFAPSASEFKPQRSKRKKEKENTP